MLVITALLERIHIGRRLGGSTELLNLLPRASGHISTLAHQCAHLGSALPLPSSSFPRMSVFWQKEELGFLVVTCHASILCSNLHLV